jgi:hypothetical protein
MSAAMEEHRGRAAWEFFRDHLDGIRVASGEELLRYPQPATECDLHYRDLLERRRRVNEELSTLKAREPGTPPDPDWLSWFEKQLSASAFADDTVSREIARLLGTENAL